MTEPLEEPLSPKPLEIGTDPRRGKYQDDLIMYTVDDFAEMMQLARSTVYKNVNA